MSSTFNFVASSPKGSTDVEALPQSLKELPIWVVEDGKRPCYPSWEWRKSDEPTTSFEDAKTELERRQGSHRAGDGLGIILEPSLDLVIIDGDKVVQESGEIHPYFCDILEESNSYAEYSTSGTGVHILIFGASGLLEDRAAKYDDFQEPWARGEVPHVDLFGSQKASNVVLTGDVVEEPRPIRESPEFVKKLHEQFPYRETTTPSETIQHTIDGDVLDFEETAGYSVPDVQATIETYAEYGTGEAQTRAEKVLTLWDSNPAPNPRGTHTHSETVAGRRYNSPSEADWDLLSGLAYYCRGDKALMLECWKASNRWTRPDKEKSPTYYHRTIENAATANTTRISRRNISRVR